MNLPRLNTPLSSCDDDELVGLLALIVTIGERLGYDLDDLSSIPLGDLISEALKEDIVLPDEMWQALTTACSKKN